MAHIGDNLGEPAPICTYCIYSKQIGASAQIKRKTDVFPEEIKEN